MSFSMFKFLHGEKGKMACNFFHQCMQASVPSPGQENNNHAKLTYPHNNGLVIFLPFRSSSLTTLSVVLGTPYLVISPL